MDAKSRLGYTVDKGEHNGLDTIHYHVRYFRWFIHME